MQASILLPAGGIWSSTRPLHGLDLGAGLKRQLHACLVITAALFSLQCPLCPRNHFAHSAFAGFAFCARSQKCVRTSSHSSQALIPFSNALFSRPGTGNQWLPNSSYLDLTQLRPPPLMGRAHYRPDGTRRRTRGELEARAKKKAQRAQEEAQAAAAAPLAEAEHGAGANGVQPEEPARAEEEMVEIEVEVAEEAEASPVRHRPRVRLRPAPKWGAVRPESPEDMDDRAGSRARARPRERRHDSRSRSPRCTELSAERLFTLSKALTRLLRHKAEAEGLHLRPDGYFCLDALVQTREMRLLRAQPAELIQVVRQDEKQRYTLRHFDGAPYLRAAQGHSQYVSKEHLMQRMRRRDLPPYLYHGTRAWNYESIARRGLLAGGPSGCRTDIHLVEHLPNSGQKVLSGWRSNCELAIQVAPQAATSGGCTFYCSDNGVYLTEGVRGAIAPQFISAVVILQTGEIITSPRAGTAPSGEAVAAGLRRAREARGRYMCAVCSLVALLCQWPLLALVPSWCTQVEAGALVWHAQFPTQAGMLMLALPRYQTLGEQRNGRVPKALRKTDGWTLDWPVGSLHHTLSFSTRALLADTHDSKCHPCHFSPSRVNSSSECTVHLWLLWGASRTTAPLGAVRSYMSHTPNSESSILWSPGDDSEDFPPSPAPAAPAARDVPAREPPAVGTPVGSLLGRVLRREHYAPEILERALDPNRSDTSTRRDDSGDADTVTATSRTAATAPIGVPKATTPTPHVPDRPSQAAWADNEVFHFDPEIYCLSTAPSASSHPVGLQYGPARSSRRACAKMLVRAGHRCPTCFCLTSLCRCPRERITFCLYSVLGGCTAHFHRGHTLVMSLCVSQAGDTSCCFRLAPLSSATLGRLFAALTWPPTARTTHILANGRSCIGPIRGDNGDCPAEQASDGLRPQQS